MTEPDQTASTGTSASAADAEAAAGCECCAPSAGREAEPIAVTRSLAAPVAPSAPRPRRDTPPSTAGMVRIPAGRFTMGTDSHEGYPSDAEGPARPVRLSAYWIDETAVTNAAFADFIDEAGYVTEAERFEWSYVFHLLVHPNAEDEVIGTADGTPWWRAVRGATWRAPFGPGSDIEELQDHPVTHISWNDAEAYAHWIGKRLPTEAEWERAARGGIEQARYAWGDDLVVDGEHQCNIWQGTFPTENTEDDGFVATAPVRAFPPNGFGLYQTAGNVWEWCADWWSTGHRPTETTDPRGPERGMSKLMRGGSYLCHDSYCNRYRVAARTSSPPDSSTGHAGFRLVLDTD